MQPNTSRPIDATFWWGRSVERLAERLFWVVGKALEARRGRSTDLPLILSTSTLSGAIPVV